MFFFVRFGAAIAAYGRVGVVGVLDVSVDLVDESGLSGCSLRLVFQTSDFPSRLGSRKLRRTGRKASLGPADRNSLSSFVFSCGRARGT